MDSQFCVDILEEALYRYTKPDIFNTDQVSQFTSELFTHVLKENNIKIGMDGKGGWRDNVLVERLWRSIKYEEIYLTAYDSIKKAKVGIQAWIFYNEERKYQTLSTSPNLIYDNLSCQYH